MNEKIKKLLGYINYFENNAKFYDVYEGKNRDDKVIEIPFYNYKQKFMSFIEEFYESNLVDQDYLEKIQPYIDKRPDFSFSDLNELINSSDYNLLRTIFTLCVRKERFCEGFWVEAIENRIFLNILYRLKEVLTIEG